MVVEHFVLNADKVFVVWLREEKYIRKAKSRKRLYIGEEFKSKKSIYNTEQMFANLI